jgi:RimJ/RimL family protein N-acetyltransferase
VIPLRRHDSADLHIEVVDTSLMPAVQALAWTAEFLAKASWSKPLPDMLIDGLRSNQWNGLALVDSAGSVSSYLDFQTRPDGIEVGICVTRPDLQGKGLMTALLSALVQAHPRDNIDIGTAENNIAMRRVIERLDFRLIGREQDRVDGEHSIYYRRLPSGRRIPAMRPKPSRTDGTALPP